MAGLHASPAFGSDVCDDLTAGLVAGCPTVTTPGGDDDDADSSFAYFFFRNNCRYRVQLAIRYRDIDGSWRTKAWWEAAPGEKFYLASNGDNVATKNAVWYYYAESLPARRHKWTGDHRVKVGDRILNMQRLEDDTGDHSLGIRCSR